VHQPDERWQLALPFLEPPHDLLQVSPTKISRRHDPPSWVLWC
jgi:hypothetical protein